MMKTIILCGGRGLRLNEETEFRPKPLVMIGNVPILVHIMNIYGKYGHREFILCLGYRGELIRDYFFHLDRYANDVELHAASGAVRVLRRRVKLDFTISFVDTGLESDTAERVLQAARYVPDDEFMVSYGDDVSDVDLDKLLTFHRRQHRRYRTYATITAAHPSSGFGQIRADERQVIQKFAEKPMLTDYVNGGFMVFTRSALGALKVGEPLERGLERLASRKRLSMYRHEGFWHGMNTMKDVHYLQQLWERGRPWTK